MRLFPLEKKNTDIRRDRKKEADGRNVLSLKRNGKRKKPAPVCLAAAGRNEGATCCPRIQKKEGGRKGSGTRQ